jgi:NAD(P)-dependent dehydrogenase (short-subunit alcohol dehydrogenase family)
LLDISPLIPRALTLFGGTASLRAALAGAGFVHGAPAGLLINAEAAPDLAGVTARCLAFAEALPAGTEGLAITVLPRRTAGLDDWQAGAVSAALHSFTKDAALTWGPRRIRVNLVEMAAGTPESDLAATILAMLRLASMTGQVVRLGALGSAASVHAP